MSEDPRDELSQRRRDVVRNASQRETDEDLMWPPGTLVGDVRGVRRAFAEVWDAILATALGRALVRAVDWLNNVLTRKPPPPPPPSPWLHSRSGHCIDPECPDRGMEHGHTANAMPPRPFLRPTRTHRGVEENG